MREVSLGKVTKVVMGQSPPSSTYNQEGKGLPFFQGKADFGDMYPKVRVYCDAPNRIAEKGDILISVRAPVGPTNVSRERACIGRGLAAIRCSSAYDSTFLLYFLRFFEQKLASTGKGSTFEAIGREDLENLVVPFIPLLEQKRIAAILAKADRLRRFRRYGIELSGSYLQSVFLEMFSRFYAANEVQALGKVVKITGGGTPSRAIRDFFTGSIPWVTAKDMWDGYISDSEEHVTRAAIDSSAAQLTPKDTLLVVVKSKVLMHRLPIAVTTKPMCHNQDIKALHCSQDNPPLFIMYALKHHETALLRQARGANTEGLTLPMLQEVPVPVCSEGLKKRFTQIVHRFERLRAQQREAARQAEHLFQTLLHQAFSGELSEVPA